MVRNLYIVTIYVTKPTKSSWMVVCDIFNISDNAHVVRFILYQCLGLVSITGGRYALAFLVLKAEITSSKPLRTVISAHLPATSYILFIACVAILTFP